MVDEPVWVAKEGDPGKVTQPIGSPVECRCEGHQGSRIILTS